MKNLLKLLKVSLGGRHAGLNRARSDRKPTRRDMLFANVADKLSGFIFRRKEARKRKMQFLLCRI